MFCTPIVLGECVQQPYQEVRESPDCGCPEKQTDDLLCNLGVFVEFLA